MSGAKNIQWYLMKKSVRLWWSILSEGRQIQEKIRYLGVHIAKNISLKSHLEHMSTKLNNKSSKIKMVSRQIVKPNRLISLFYLLMTSMLG